jgi:hypothetical protein
MSTLCYFTEAPKGNSDPTSWRADGEGKGLRNVLFALFQSFSS